MQTLFPAWLPVPGSPEAIALAQSVVPIVMLAIPFYCLYRAAVAWLRKG
jgi:Na+-driven multidrug efflux pump